MEIVFIFREEEGVIGEWGNFRVLVYGDVISEYIVESREETRGLWHTGH